MIEYLGYISGLIAYASICFRHGWLLVEPQTSDGELRVWLVRCPQSVEGNVISFVFPHLPGEGCLILRDDDLLPTFLLPSSPRLLAISSSQWASQDHICLHLIAVGLARPQLRAPSRSGPRRTSTGESLSAVGLAGAQPARVGALWASPDSNG